jgi:hypothetical protein
VGKGERHRLTARVGLILLAAWTVAGCSPSPEDPGAGELTGVVVSKGDSIVLGDGGTSDAYDRVVVLTADQLVEAYRTTWPGRDDPEDHDYQNINVRIPVADLVALDEQDAPAPTAAVAQVEDGRFRIPWQVGPAYVCLGNEIRTDADNELVVDTSGCVMVDRSPPTSVTIETGYGGLGVSD